MRAATLEIEFMKGNYRQVAEAFARKPELARTSRLLPIAVGAAVFLGEIEKARAIFADEASADARLSADARAACQFYLGVGETRRSEYAKARGWFARNARLPKRERTAMVRFFTAQGLAFYRFFSGRYRLAERYAQTAYELALKTDFVYGELLSRDLLGHALINVGSVRLGLKHIDTTSQLAEAAGDGSADAAYRTTVLRIRAKFGLAPETCVGDLERALHELHVDDTYTRAEIALELARQITLRGDLDTAREVLNDSCDFIYRNQNRRQAATLNLRFAHLSHLEGQHHQALHLLRVAETALVPEVDRSHLAQMRGLRARIESYLGRTSEAARILEDQVAGERSLSSFVHSRILARARGEPSRAPYGEDPLGDLVDFVRRKDAKALPLILQTGYLGLLRDYFEIAYGLNALVFDLVPGSVTIVSATRVRFVTKGLNGNLRRVIRLIAARTADKETLIREIWRYDYDPLRHDALAYAAIAKLRKLIEPFGAWIEFGEDGYRLRGDVHVIFHAQRPGKTPELRTEIAAPPLAKSATLDADLNFRQLQILDHLTEVPALGVADCASVFGVSKITASRDLSLLNELGHCKRIGKGRATRYVRGMELGGSR